MSIKNKFVAGTFTLLFILFFKYSFTQDSILIYDVATMSLTTQLMPAYNNNTPSDSTEPYFGTYGVTDMPVIAPTVTYPNTEISLIQKASDYYTSLNFPFTAVTLIRYGLNVTAAVIGKRALLVFNYDIYYPNSQQWRNLSDTNPFYENGSIQYGFLKLTPVRYYSRNHPQQGVNFAIIEVAEDIGDYSGYFGLAYDTVPNAYDSVLLYNLSYPNEGFPGHYSIPVNGDTLCMKYGYIPDSYPIFSAYWGGNGEYVSPFFDKNYRIHGIRWSYSAVYKFRRPDFYFAKYVLESLLTTTGDLVQNIFLNIFPNPATNHITIEFDLTETTNISIEIKNILGQTVKEIDSSLYSNGKNKIEIDVSEFSQGLYFMQLKSENEFISKKFVKQ